MTVCVCDKVVCDKELRGRLCDKVVCERFCFGKIVCEKVVCVCAWERLCVWVCATKLRVCVCVTKLRV